MTTRRDFLALAGAFGMAAGSPLRVQAQQTRLARVGLLAARGRVSRGPDPSDRRGVKVTLTAAGRAVCDAAMADLLERERALLSQLPASERDQLAQLLRQLLSPFEG